jgi:hypothetical protein
MRACKDLFLPSSTAVRSILLGLLPDPGPIQSSIPYIHLVSKPVHWALNLRIVEVILDGQEDLPDGDFWSPSVILQEADIYGARRLWQKEETISIDAQRYKDRSYIRPNRRYIDRCGIYGLSEIDSET